MPVAEWANFSKVLLSFTSKAVLSSHVIVVKYIAAIFFPE